MSDNIKYHPGLPSIKQARDNYELFLSDHIPIVANIGDITCVSWNVMETDSCNGVAPLGQSEYNETKVQRQARYKRIADAVSNILEQQKPDFFTLQEIVGREIQNEQPELWLAISEKLKDTDYAAAMDSKGSIIDISGNITLYNKKKFTLDLNNTPSNYNTPGQLRDSLVGLGAHGLVFDHKTNSAKASKIRICNVHAQYNENPQLHEQMIHEFLNEGGKYDTSIVIGDFNCMFNTISDTPQIITTSVVPNIFREKKMQGACAIDGAFYKIGLKKSEQAPSQHIDPVTGKVYDSSILTPSDSNTNTPQDQVNEETRFRPAMCLDKQQYAKLINRVNASLDNKYQIAISPAINLKNQRALAIIFPAKLCSEKDYTTLKTSAHKLVDSNTGTSSNVIYLPIKDHEIELGKLFPNFAPINNFMTAYSKQLKQDKMRYFGLFSRFRISRVTETMTLKEIITHAQSENNRSRSVCVQLGWLNPDGTINDNAPDAVKKCVEPEKHVENPNNHNS